MKSQKGGIESIIGLVILVGLLIALIVAVILPMITSTVELNETATGAVNTLKDKINGSESE